MKKEVVMVLLVALEILIGPIGSQVAHGQVPWEDSLYFERCDEVRQNSTEYDRCVGDERNKHRADINKSDELNLDRCREFLIPYHKLNYEQCVGEEFNKFPEYGPEVMQQYLAGGSWTWPKNDPPWWDDYFPTAETEEPEEGEFYRWWENDFFITAPSHASWGTDSWAGGGDSSIPGW